MPIYKDKERGTYYFITRVNGKQIKRRGFKSSGEARKAEAAAILDAEEINGEDPLFEYVAKEYLSWYKKRRKGTSYERIKGIVDNHLLPVFGKKKINSIRNRDITKFHDTLIGQNSIATNKLIHAVLSAVFNFAIKNEYATNNPARVVGNLEGEATKRIDYWTLEEFKVFISEADEFIYYTLFMTLYYSGMRRGEALALNWGDIDFDNDTINVDKTKIKNRVETTSTKNGVNRKIQMPKFVMRLLSQLKAQSETDPKMTYVVFGSYKKPLAETTVSRRFQKYIKISQVKKIRLHDLRHSHASYLINKNTVISVISQRLGHKNVSTTLNTYSHLYPTTEKEAVLDMENDFKKADIVQIAN